MRKALDGNKDVRKEKDRMDVMRKKLIDPIEIEQFRMQNWHTIKGARLLLKLHKAKIKNVK